MAPIMAHEIIETSLGNIWIEDQDNGDMRVWWPHQSPVGELAAPVLKGRARWHPKSHGWYVPAKRRDEIYEELCEL